MVWLSDCAGVRPGLVTGLVDSRTVTDVLIGVAAVSAGAAIIGAIVHLATDIPIAAALLLGAILSATDPVAVIALFGASYTLQQGEHVRVDIFYRRFSPRTRAWVDLLGTLLLYAYPRSARIVIPSVYLGSGLGVWLFARSAYHIGASGLVFGLLTFLQHICRWSNALFLVGHN